jgi:amidohydrolase
VLHCRQNNDKLEGRIVELRDRVWRRIDQLEERLWDLALRIHRHPEVAFAEEKAAGWLAEFLEAEGFSVERGVAGLPTAFRAVHPAEGDGPALAILAEYDALPELGHACGHNLIAAIAVGAAAGLAPWKPDLAGRLVVLGTPAEEGGGGKVILIREGLFRDIDAAMMVHPGCHTYLRHGSLAISEVVASFRGRAAHASTDPEEGINALDAVIQTFNSINALRQHIRDGARIHGIITDGGQKPNIVPEHAAARFYVRAAQSEYRDELLAKLERCARGAALATGAELSFRKTSHEYKSMRINEPMASAFGRHIEGLGYPVEESGGGMGSTDMGDVSWQVPAIHPLVRITEQEIPLHSRQFAQAARSEGARRAIIAAAKAVAATCLDLWLDPDLYTRVKEEFNLTRARRS